MCGIFGSVVTSAATHVYARAWLDALRHRGPDGRGCLIWDGQQIYRQDDVTLIPGRVMLGHTRLAVQDPTPRGDQPMSTRDDACHIVFNGEVYNFPELRRELEAAGEIFRSGTDTEVVLAAYRVWGDAAFARFRGMFALAILDLRNSCLVLARDPFGIKPLYYTAWREGIAFASEIGPLLGLPGVTGQFHSQSLFEYLASGLTDHSEYTLLDSVRQLPAAHWASISLDQVHMKSPAAYWKPELGQTLEVSFAEASELVRRQFLHSIEMHLRSDVPVGSALSGGIDSSAIICAARHVAPAADIHAFSYVADDPAINEERWIDVVGRHAGARVHKVRASEQGLVRHLKRLVRVQGEPFGSTSIYAQHLVFRKAHETGVKVLLDGQGADELLGGYLVYQAARLASLIGSGHWLEGYAFARRVAAMPGRSYQTLARSALHMILPHITSGLARRLGLRRKGHWIREEWIRQKEVNRNSLLLAPCRKNCLRQMLLQTLTRSSVPMLLRYEDRNSMAWSVESRVPFLTQEMAELLLHLPEQYIIGPDGQTKRVFRSAMRGIVPDLVLDRQDKIGFATPEKIWLGQLSGWVEENLDQLDDLPMIDAGAARTMWRDMQQGRRPFDWQLWRLINLVQWVGQLEKQG